MAPLDTRPDSGAPPPLPEGADSPEAAGGRLFGDLPASLFRVFTGRNGPFFADLLAFLDDELFGIAGETVTRRQAIAAVGEFIDRQARDLAFDDEESEGLGPDDRREADPRRSIAFGRLARCGWFVEHRDRYRRIVDFDPDARLLLQALLDIRDGRLRSYGGEVLQVLGQLEAAAANPAERSESIRNAARSARAFLHHLRSISGAMRRIEQAIVDEQTVRAMFSRFFEDFVERHLIEDFKRLHTANNPFRFRTRLVRLAHEILEDGLLVAALAEAYVREGRAPGTAEAGTAVEDELQTVITVFTAVDDHLDLIAATNQRVERRIRNTIRFLDRIAESRTDLITAAIRDLGRSGLPHDATVDVPHALLLADLPLGARHLYQGRPQRRPLARQAIRKPPKDPALVLYQQAKREYAERARVTADKVRAYLDRHLDGRDAIAAADLAVETLDDFFVFERLRDLPYGFARQLGGAYRLELRDGRLENDWIECPDFVIRRVWPEEDGPAGEARHGG